MDSWSAKVFDRWIRQQLTFLMNLVLDKDPASDLSIFKIITPSAAQHFGLSCHVKWRYCLSSLVRKADQSLTSHWPVISRCCLKFRYEIHTHVVDYQQHSVNPPLFNKIDLFLIFHVPTKKSLTDFTADLNIINSAKGANFPKSSGALATPCWGIWLSAQLSHENLL